MESSPHYTVFIRLPFPRSEFQDPPQVEWDAAKDQQLWKMISKASHSKELNWDQMSARFHVPLPFLLQQAAWLYERHFEGMKAQMKRLSVAGGTHSGLTSPIPAVDALAIGTNTQRPGSEGAKAGPSIQASKNSPKAAGEHVELPSTPTTTKPDISRTPSTNTVTQSRTFTSPRPSSIRSVNTPAKQASSNRPGDGVRQGDDRVFPSRDLTSEPESEYDDVQERSRAFSKHRFEDKSDVGTLSSDADAEDDDQDSSGGFLPFAAATSSSKSPRHDLAATLKSSPRNPLASPQHSTAAKSKAKDAPPLQASSTSSMSSPREATSPHNRDTIHSQAAPLSPKRRAELEKLSPRYQDLRSEGSPSIGSSFSDLDDTSITQSALGEALLSNMQHGSIGMDMGSRIR